MRGCHLNHHRESEDLDFDSLVDKRNYKKIETYFLNILNKFKKKGLIKNYSKGKSGLATTGRYHLKLKLETYKTNDTKIDVDFVTDVKNLDKKENYFFIDWRESSLRNVLLLFLEKNLKIFMIFIIFCLNWILKFLKRIKMLLNC